MLDQLFGGGGGAGFQHHASGDRLAEGAVGHADHRRVGHRGVLHQRDLDLLGIDVEPAGHDHVLGAVDEIEEPVGVEIADIAGAEPVAVERGDGGLGVAEIFAHHRCAAGRAGADQKLAGLALGHILAVRVDDADLDAEDRPAGRMRPLRLLLGAQPGDVPRLGLGEEGVEPDMRQRRPQPLLERDREDLARGDDQAERRRRLGPLLQLRHHHAEDGRHAAGDGHLLALDQRDRIGGVEAGLHRQPAARDEHVGEPAEPGAVRHRRRRQHHVALRQFPFDHVGEAGEDDVRVGPHRALGPARRARGVGDHAVVLGGGRAGWRRRRAGGEERRIPLLPRFRIADDDADRAGQVLQPGGDGGAHALAVDNRPGLAIAEDIGDLLGGEPRGQGNDQRAELENRRHRLGQLDLVRHGDDDPVAAAHTARGERVGEPVAARVQLGEGEAPVAADQRDLVRVALRILREQGGELHPSSGSKAK